MDMEETLDTTEIEKKRRSVVQSLPSDYSDVQPKYYDPEFISDISNMMQVPDSIPVMNGGDPVDTPVRLIHDMQVPERILVAGGGQHYGGRPELEPLDLESHARSRRSDEYVGLLTPPRVLTLEESFLKEEEEHIEFAETPQPVPAVPNGSALVPEPYTPGRGACNSLLLNEEGEQTQLRTQVAKLMRRVAVMEHNQQSRGSREVMFYTATFSYLMIKLLWWLFRSK